VNFEHQESSTPSEEKAEPASGEGSGGEAGGQPVLGEGRALAEREAGLTPAPGSAFDIAANLEMLYAEILDHLERAKQKEGGLAAENAAFRELRQTLSLTKDTLETVYVAQRVDRFIESVLALIEGFSPGLRARAMDLCRSPVERTRSVFDIAGNLDDLFGQLRDHLKRAQQGGLAAENAALRELRQALALTKEALETIYTAQRVDRFLDAVVDAIDPLEPGPRSKIVRALMRGEYGA
jgi:hypothetical protein